MFATSAAKEVEIYVYLLSPWTISIIYHLCHFCCVTQCMQQDKFTQTEDQRNRKILFIRSFFIVMLKAVFCKSQSKISFHQLEYCHFLLWIHVASSIAHRAVHRLWHLIFSWLNSCPLLWQNHVCICVPYTESILIGNLCVSFSSQPKLWAHLLLLER